MASGTPTDDSPGGLGATRDGGHGATQEEREAPSLMLGNALFANLDDAQWRQANQLLEHRYLGLGRAQIDEMCLDLKARLSATISAGLQQRLRVEAHAPRTDAPRTDAHGTDAPRTDAARTDAPGIDFTQSDAQRQLEAAA